MLTNSTGKDVTINAKNIYTPRTNLGHKKSPAGDRNIQYRAVYDKAQELTQAVITSGCERRDSRMLFQAVWKPVVEYVLPQAFLTQHQLDTIQKRNFPLLYAKCG